METQDIVLPDNTNDSGVSTIKNTSMLSTIGDDKTIFGQSIFGKSIPPRKKRPWRRRVKKTKMMIIKEKTPSLPKIFIILIYLSTTFYEIYAISKKNADSSYNLNSKSLKVYEAIIDVYFVFFCIIIFDIPNIVVPPLVYLFIIIVSITYGILKTFLYNYRNSQILQWYLLLINIIIKISVVLYIFFLYTKETYI